MQYDSTVLKPRTQDLTDRSFERLTVLAFAGYRHYQAHWTCQCSCGTIKDIAASHLLRHDTKSCGCLMKDFLRKRWTTHGKTETAEYNVWTLMIRRCENTKTDDYKRYGGRGITVCDAWHDFATFYADMGPRPSSQHSIERLNNDQGYSPDNCIWGTRVMQNGNTRRNCLLTLNNVTKCLQEWSRFTGFSRHTITQRLLLGWSVEKALTTPPRQRQKR